MKPTQVQELPFVRRIECSWDPLWRRLETGIVVEMTALDLKCGKPQRSELLWTGVCRWLREKSVEQIISIALPGPAGWRGLTTLVVIFIWSEAIE